MHLLKLTALKRLVPSLTVSVLLSTLLISTSYAQDADNTNQQSTARAWTDALLFAITQDLARPTVHARNLFHLSAAMFDAWAIYEPGAKSVFTVASSDVIECSLIDNYRTEAYQTGSISSLSPEEKTLAQNQAVGMAAWTVLNHRFKDNRRQRILLAQFRRTGEAQGLESTETKLDDEYFAQNLGIQVGRCIIDSNLNDGANELDDYANKDYTPTNPPLDPTKPGNPELVNPNRWQPLQLDIFIDQSGNLTDTPAFLGADWGQLQPFALDADDKSDLTIGSTTVPVWLDPGAPPFLSTDPVANRLYQLNHLLVALWSAHLDPNSSTSIDISPGSLGNLPPIDSFPDEHGAIWEEYESLEGGMDENRGHAFNPSNAKPYESNVVPLGDYTRVLAEFWADGPDSETPPGHWYGIYNQHVSDHPLHERRLVGQGAVLDPLAYDVITYLALGGALHDSAIAAWSTKRAYDYARPITAIRYMAALGQSSDPKLANYHVRGIPLVPGRVESIEAGDALAGDNNENVGKIKALVWLGPTAISDPKTDVAGVGWQLLENWWPYQRPTFVTPPFAGFVSGHSTFSRAAAEVLTAATGNEFFPGGIAEFVAQKDSFLIFEKGPSVDVRLQWATYRDASDQTSLSRIWGGIHPPADDLVGRKMGAQIGLKSWERVTSMIAELYPDNTFDPNNSIHNQPDTGEPETDETSELVAFAEDTGSGCNINQKGSNLSLVLLLLIAFTRQFYKVLMRLFPTIPNANIHIQRH